MAVSSLLYVTQVAPYRDGPAGVHGVLDQSSTAMAELAGLAGLGFHRVDGAGRVFSTTLGRFPAAWERAEFLRFVAGGLSWALGEGD